MMKQTDLPNLQSFKTGDRSFYYTTSLSLSSMIIKFDYLTFSNLPNLQSFKTGWKSFEKTTSLSLSSMIIKFSINQLTRCSFHKWRIQYKRSIYEYEC